MNRFGHVGFTLLLLSPFMSKLGTQFVLFSALFAVLPDIDIVLKVKHRGVHAQCNLWSNFSTHSICNF